MWLKVKNSAASSLALGLFAGRVLSEQWAEHHGINILVPIFLTVGLSLLAFHFLRHHSLSQTWPLLLLLGYVVHPYPNPRAAGTAIIVLTAVIFQLLPRPTRLSQERRVVRLVFAGTTLFFIFLYVNTLAPGLLPADNGEFQLVGSTLGVAHPPGFPLYTLLSKLMTWLPFPAAEAYKINILSAFTSATTLGLLYLTVFYLTRHHLAAITAVLSLGTASTFWAQATTANIRSLTALLAMLAIFALFRHQRLKAQTDRYLIIFAAALSFGLTHHLSLAFMGAIFALSLFLIDPAFFHTSSRWRRPFLAGLAGLIPLIYLPLRAGADVPGARESLSSLAGFFNHFLALGFQGDFFYFVQPVVLWPRLQVMGNVLTMQFSPWLLASALLGWALLLKQQWRLALLLGGAFAVHTLVTATYRAPQTVEYMLPAYLPVAICVGVACGRLSDRGLELPTSSRWLPLTMTAVLFTAAVGQGWQRWPSFAFLHQVEEARAYAQNILDQAPPESLVLANWHWVTPLWYLQIVENQRPDVTIVYVAPGADPYSQTWASEIADGLARGHTVVATYVDPDAYTGLPLSEPLGEALVFRQTPRTEMPADFIPVDGDFGEQMSIFGYRLEQKSIEVGLEATITVAWQGSAATPMFVHLLDESGSLIAQADVTAVPQPEGISLTQFRLSPRRGPGDFRLRLGSSAEFLDLGMLTVLPASLPPATEHPVYRPIIEGTSRRTLIGYDWDSSLPGQSRLYLHWQTDDGYFSTTHDNQPPPALNNTIGPWGLSWPAWTVPAANPSDHYVPLGQGIVWTGESLNDLPNGLAPDGEYALPMRFINGRPLLRDYVVSTRLVGLEADGFTWAWCDLIDSVPAMGGIPTLKWIQGSRIQSPRAIIYRPDTNPAVFSGFCQSEKPAPGAPFHYVDNTALPGQSVGGLLRLYDAFTNRPLPILDERITAVYSWIPLGETIIEE